MKLKEFQAKLIHIRKELPEEAVLAFIDKALENDLPLFCQVMFPHMFTKPFGNIQYELMDLLQGDKEKIAIAFPRRHGKTTIEKGFILWCVAYKKYNYMIWLGDTIDLISKQLINIRRELEENQLFKAVYGDLSKDVIKWNEDELYLSNGFHIIVKSVGQSFRGLLDTGRPDYLLGDDIDNDETTASVGQRNKVDDWIFNSVLPSLSEDGKVRFIGTCIHADSQLMRLINNKTWNNLVYSAILDEGTSTERAVCEEIYSLEKLKAKKLELFCANPPKVQTWWQEYMNKPANPDNVAWDISNLQYWQGKYEEGFLIINNNKMKCRTFTAVDLASSRSSNKHSDFSTVVSAAITPDKHLYLLKCWRKQNGQPSEIVEEIFKQHELYNTVDVIIETVVCQDYIMETYDREAVQHKTRPVLNEIKNRQGSGSKEDRIKGALQDRIRLGMVHVRDGMTDLVEELNSFPQGAHDDLIDALADIAINGFPPIVDEEVKKSHLPEALQPVERTPGEDDPFNFVRQTVDF